MHFFQEPAPTRYDLRFNVAGIPVRVHPLFWLVTLLFGAASSNLLDLPVWMAAVFVSILVHELGHALAMRSFGQSARITLYFGGGLTTPESVSWGYGSARVALTVNQEIVTLLAGAGAGFLVAGLVLGGVAALGGTISIVLLFGLLPFPLASLPAGGGFVDLILFTLLWVNIFWGVINLMPVFPLDGGQIARHLWLKVDRWGGVRKSLWLSVVVGAIMALVGLVMMNSLYVAFLFGVLAFQSYMTLQGRAMM
ncbi:MAG: site-2 protease family protein [Anaerolineales bacterium]